jgi:hypothetical protein
MEQKFYDDLYASLEMLNRVSRCYSIIMSKDIGVLIDFKVKVRTNDLRGTIVNIICLFNINDQSIVGLPLMVDSGPHKGRIGYFKQFGNGKKVVLYDVDTVEFGIALAAKVVISHSNIVSHYGLNRKSNTLDELKTRDRLKLESGYETQSSIEESSSSLIPS